MSTPDSTPNDNGVQRDTTVDVVTRSARNGSRPLNGHSSTLTLCAPGAVSSPRPGEDFPDWGAASVADHKSPLGILTNTASASASGGFSVPVSGAAVRASSARSLRFFLQSAARNLLPNHRVAWCLRRPVPGDSTVNIHYSPEHKRAYYSNLCTCARIWECPVCAARVSERRRDLLRRCFADGRYFLGMLTLTVQHHRGEPCGVVLDRLLAAYRRFTSGRWFQGLMSRYRIRGTLRALEPTYGDNGWHPHLHVLFVFDSVITPRVEAEIYAFASRRWSDLVAKEGGYASGVHGCDFRAGDEHAADYVNKLTGEVTHLASRWSLADEVSKAVVKRGRDGGRTLTELLYDYAVNDDLEAGALWREGVAAMSGHKHLSPSRGFWPLFGLVGADDEELATEQVSAADELLAALTLDQWRVVLAADKRAEVLNAASEGDVAALHAYLRSIGVSGPLVASEGVSVGSGDGVVSVVKVDLNEWGTRQVREWAAAPAREWARRKRDIPPPEW